MNASLVLAFALLLAAPSDLPWRLPATIEVQRDVEVGRGPYVRGTLSMFGPDLEGFVIKKAERFQMVKIYEEGGCRIRFHEMERDISSCYWVEGFADPESDIFKVISGHLVTAAKTKRK
jgi:hypothetical protein